MNFEKEKFEKILKRSHQDGFSERFLTLKEQNFLNYELGALKLKKELCDEVILNKKNLMICGNTGIGKSFLAFEIAFELKKINPDFGAYYNRANILISEFKANFSNIKKTLDGVFERESYYYGGGNISNKIIIIDECHNIEFDKDFLILDELIFTAYDKMIPVIIISNKNCEFLHNKFKEMAMSRFCENAILKDLHGKDLRNMEVSK